MQEKSPTVAAARAAPPGLLLVLRDTLVRARGSVFSAPRAVVGRLHEVAVCVALTALAFLQSPGKIVADTKIDLALNPVQWLGRSLHLWDPSGSFGQVQNQAYGYLWPMGPFFALGTGIGLPGWVVQRLWWALLFCVAFLGVVRLAERLGIGTPTSRLVAGVVFALSPRILTELGRRLGRGVAERGRAVGARPARRPREGRAASGGGVALSALAVACAGGVNATAVVRGDAAGVPVAADPAPRCGDACSRSLAWCAAVLAVTAWWLVPLLVLGRYSPPFLDYIETAVDDHLGHRPGHGAARGELLASLARRTRTAR